VLRAPEPDVSGKEVLHPVRPAIAVAGALLSLALTGCSGAPSGETTSASTAAIPSTTSEAPAGQPAPAELQGTWKLIAIDGKPYEAQFIIAISDRKYAVRSTDVNGDLVVNGSEIAFFNENLCIRGTSGAGSRVGRYAWTLKGRTLHFDLVGSEPCGDRTGIFEDATYKRLG
jgi:hypothetical protein